GIGCNLAAHSLELSAADVLQVLPLGSGGCRLVEIDWNLVALPDLLAHPPGDGHAVFQCDTVDGNEWHHIGRANSGMRYFMTGQINQLSGFTHAANGSLGDGLAISN